MRSRWRCPDPDDDRTRCQARAHPVPAAARLPWQVAFLVLAGIWGCSFYFIKLGLEGLNPIQVAFGRCMIGALALVVVTAVSRTRLPRNAATWGHLFVMATLMNVIAPATESARPAST